MPIIVAQQPTTGYGWGVRLRRRDRYRFTGDKKKQYGGSGGGINPPIPPNALLNEDGTPILNENGDYILV